MQTQNASANTPKSANKDLKEYFSGNREPLKSDDFNFRVKIATARCARLSFMTFDNEIDYEKDIQLHDRLLADGHMSPFEHCARVMDDVEFESYHKGQFVPESDSIAEDIGMAISNDAFGWCNNFKGFIPYRYLIENKIENENI